MPGACRAEQDVAGGVIARGSQNVFVNDRPFARVGDPVNGHAPGPHRGPVMATGSSTVRANNIRACKSGDVASCGHSATGSDNVRIGG